MADTDNTKVNLEMVPFLKELHSMRRTPVCEKCLDGVKAEGGLRAPKQPGRGGQLGNLPVGGQKRSPNSN